jgi:DNA-binding NtrC family response regulator
VEQEDQTGARVAIPVKLLEIPLAYMTNPVSTPAAVDPTILLVEDDLDLQSLFTAVLASQGYNVLAANNGKEAMTLLRNNEVGLLITDLVMSEQEGLETIIGARKEFPKLKILVVSGYAEYFKAAILCGAYDCMEKPVEPHVLRNKVRAMVAG